MSARLIKILVAVCLLHVIILSVLWVGFPVPLPKPQVDFVYVGGSVEEGSNRSAAQSPASVAQGFDFDHFDAPTFAPWMNLRMVDKPRR